MVEKTNYRPKTVNIVGPQGVGKSTIGELVKERFSAYGISYSSINCTGYGSSPPPLQQLGRITDYSISFMDKTGKVFPFLGIAGLNSTILYNLAKHVAMEDNPDVILITRNPYLDSCAMGDTVLKTSVSKRLSRRFSKILAYDPPDLLIHLDAQSEVLYERVIKRIEQGLTATGKQKPHPYEKKALLERIRNGYFGPIREISDNNNTKVLQVDTSDLSIEEVFEVTWNKISELLKIDL